MTDSQKQLFLSKYQPTSFANFESNDDTFEVLRALITLNKLNILFIGDIGTGKTTYLNAIIREYYGPTVKPGDNVLYINSLKEQGINYYRNEVKTFCQTCCSIKGKQKIIVLDDIDVINDQSQQVFRSYMDKYSHNVHFIASCGNLQKTIDTLQSRFTIMKIKPLLKHNLKNIVTKIAGTEHIDMTEDATEFALNVCNNNIKVLISYMEKFKLLNQKITLDLAVNVCTNISFSIFERYTELVKEGAMNLAIKVLYDIYDKGYSVMDILDNYFLFVKITNMLTESQKYEVIPLLCKYITVFHNIHEDEIELALFTNNLVQQLNK